MVPVERKPFLQVIRNYAIQYKELTIRQKHVLYESCVKEPFADVVSPPADLDGLLYFLPTIVERREEEEW